MLEMLANLRLRFIIILLFWSPLPLVLLKRRERVFFVVVVLIYARVAFEFINKKNLSPGAGTSV